MRIFAPQTNLFRDIKSAKLYIAFFSVLSYFYAFKGSPNVAGFFLWHKDKKYFSIFVRKQSIFFYMC